MDLGWLSGALDAFDSNRQRRRIVGYFAGLVVIALGYALAYMAAMAVFEGEPQTFTESLQVVVQSFTTTGYGEDAHLWTTWQLHALTIAMQLTGVGLLFTALPVFVGPWVADRLSTAAPTSIENEDHVVICGYTSRGEALIDELTARGIAYVVVEPDRDLAADIYESDDNVVHADPETEEGLERASGGEARAVVADVDDETNASIALTAGQLDGVQVLTFVEEPDIADYHRYAGADQVFSPRQLVGDSLARKVLAGVTPGLDDAIELDEDFEVAELPVQAGSDLAGRTVAESGIRERTGTNVIGAWFRGEFVSTPSPEARIDEQTILLVAGRDEQLEQLKELTLSERRRHQPGNIVVAGYGEVGSTVSAALEAEGVDCTVVDEQDRDGVDVVGDATEEAVLEEAGVDEDATVILALSDDTITVFATLVIREIAPSAEVIARADATDSVGKLYQAGADYVLALATVSGRMLAATILREDVLSFGQQVELVRTDCGDLAGETLGGADIRAETGCTVVAVEREGRFITDLGPEFRIATGDKLIVAGTDEDVNRFASLVE